MFVYCLHCSITQSRTIASMCERLLGCRAIIPMWIRHLKRQSRMYDVPAELVPGYLYLYAEHEPLNTDALIGMEGVHEILGSRDTDYVLEGQERSFALMLLNCGGVLGKTKVLSENGRLSLPVSAFAPLSAEILRVDRRYSNMQLKFNYGNPPLTLWVEYEVASEGEQTL